MLSVVKFQANGVSVTIMGDETDIANELTKLVLPWDSSLLAVYVHVFCVTATATCAASCAWLWGAHAKAKISSVAATKERRKIVMLFNFHLERISLLWKP